MNNFTNKFVNQAETIEATSVYHLLTYTNFAWSNLGLNRKCLVKVLSSLFSTIYPQKSGELLSLSN
jgi:hypothetical protein